MPPWLTFVLALVGCVVWTGLLAAGVTGRWSTFWLAAKQFTLVLLGLALPAILVGIGLLIFAT